MNSSPFPHVDVLVVGAGIVGLAHAVEAVDRGLSVAVVERDHRAVGASVRNFGHVTITAQAGRALGYAEAGRGRWLDLASKAGFWLAESGTLVLARVEDEVGVLQEFAATRGSDRVRLVEGSAIGDLLPTYDRSARVAAHFPLDLRVDSRVAVPAIATWLAQQGVAFHWGTSVGWLGDGVIGTGRGEMTADRIVVAIGHDVDRLAPDIAEAVDLQRCQLQMLEVSLPTADQEIEPALLSGLSLLRYKGFLECPSLDDVRRRIQAANPEFLDNYVNLMLTQRPGGNIILGDTHHYAGTHDPFVTEDLAGLLLAEGSRLLGVSGLTVRRRWLGTYARSTTTDFLVEAVHPSTRIVSVTSGIGMTTAFGFAAEVAAELF